MQGEEGEEKGKEGERMVRERSGGDPVYVFNLSLAYGVKCPRWMNCALTDL